MRKDSVYQYVLTACAQQDPVSGVTAQEVANALGIWRNDATVDLNKLVADGMLCRQGKRDVHFFPAVQTSQVLSGGEAESADNVKAFSNLVGADGSLKYQLRIAKAAVTYPPYGLNMLITGPTGSGKSHFARTIWEYAKEIGAFQSAHGSIPFVVFNCAEYTANPQLLLSHLFGYKKGAFTGAFEDKPGLVEQANNGILFLDEIHCLSSAGQETFFTLLDTGVFHRIGDNTQRHSHFMLIGATTKPHTDLLETFLRRMPVLISRPTLSDRPIKERLELVEHFYAEEASHIGRTLRIKREALNSILDYSLHSNLGTLKNMVQISCAKAFLRENTPGNRSSEIKVTFSDLSFQTYNLTTENKPYPNGELRFQEDLVVPSPRFQGGTADISPFVDIYDFVEDKMSGSSIQAAGGVDIQQMVTSEISNYYLNMERLLQSPDLDETMLSSILFPGCIGICSEFLSRATYELERSYPPMAATLFAMHISQYVSRMRSEQPALPFSFRNSMTGYVREMEFLQKNRDWLSTVLKAKISDDEMNCLAILLHQVGDRQDAPPVWITLVSDSEGVAAGMAKYLNSVYHTSHVHWVDGRTDNTLFNAVCDSISTFHGSSGNLVFTDIKALASLEPELVKSTGIPCKVIPVLEQRLLLEANRLTLDPEVHDLASVKRHIIESYSRLMGHLFRSSGVDLCDLQNRLESENPERIILSICVTGIGSAKSIQEILEKRLSYIPRLRVVAISSLENMEAIAQAYRASLKLIVGTIDPHIPGVPFITADQVFSSRGLLAIASLVDDWTIHASRDSMETAELLEEESYNSLIEGFHFIAPHVNQELAVSCIGELARTLEQDHYKKPLPQDVHARLFMHAASMLERIVDGNTLQMEPEHEVLIYERAQWFVFLENLTRRVFAPFGYDIPRAEHFYFMLSLPETL